MLGRPPFCHRPKVRRAGVPSGLAGFGPTELGVLSRPILASCRLRLWVVKVGAQGQSGCLAVHGTVRRCLRPLLLVLVRRVAPLCVPASLTRAPPLAAWSSRPSPPSLLAVLCAALGASTFRARGSPTAVVAGAPSALSAQPLSTLSESRVGANSYGESDTSGFEGNSPYTMTCQAKRGQRCPPADWASSCSSELRFCSRCAVLAELPRFQKGRQFRNQKARE